jgi:acylglycerol lipase
VRLMDDAADSVGDDHVPTLYLYGANDEIIPKNAALKAVKGLRPTDRTALYAKGYHLLTRDRQGPAVWADVLSFIRDPKAALPSGAPPIPGAPLGREPDRRSAGL